MLFWRSYRSGRNGTALVIAAIAAGYLLYFVQGLNRPDIWHLRWPAWLGCLLLAIVIRDWVERAGFAMTLPRRHRRFIPPSGKLVTDLVRNAEP